MRGRTHYRGWTIPLTITRCQPRCVKPPAPPLCLGLLAFIPLLLTRSKWGVGWLQVGAMASTWSILLHVRWSIVVVWWLVHCCRFPMFAFARGPCACEARFARAEAIVRELWVGHARHFKAGAPCKYTLRRSVVILPCLIPGFCASIVLDCCVDVVGSPHKICVRIS